MKRNRTLFEYYRISYKSDVIREIIRDGDDMNEPLNNYKIALALLGGIWGWIFGESNPLIYALIAFVAIDYITGVLLAIRERRVSSKIGFKGISKKIMIFVLVAVGNIIDQYILNSGSSLKTMIIMFYISNEGISILENSDSLGVPLPPKLKNVLKQLNSGDGER